MIAEAGKTYKIGRKMYKAVERNRFGCRHCVLTTMQCNSDRTPDCMVNKVVFRPVESEAK